MPHNASGRNAQPPFASAEAAERTNLKSSGTWEVQKSGQSFTVCSCFVAVSESSRFKKAETKSGYRAVRCWQLDFQQLRCKVLEKRCKDFQDKISEVRSQTGATEESHHVSFEFINHMQSH